AGNLVGIVNEADVTRYWRNQKVVPETSYIYDSLYQLISVTGREMAGIAQQGTKLPSVTIPLSSGDGAYTNYRRNFSYDRGGNLTQLSHISLASNNSYTTDLTVSHHSNRVVLSSLTTEPDNVDAYFDAGGHQRQIQAGQDLSWTARGELLKATMVARPGQITDSECYRYDAASSRVVKVTTCQVGGETQTQRVVYLPGLECRTTQRTAQLTEELHVVVIGAAGRAQVRVLHWNTGTPDGIENNQLRYSYDNLIGSSGLEVDDSGLIISKEEYYPYGGTAVWTARSQVEADYKTIRYSGKERDATGLYYYGYRYYQPWACRWLSADPAGAVDGVNLYHMVRNNPVIFKDNNGMYAILDILHIDKPDAGKVALAYQRQRLRGHSEHRSLGIFDGYKNLHNTEHASQIILIGNIQAGGDVNLETSINAFGGGGAFEETEINDIETHGHINIELVSNSGDGSGSSQKIQIGSIKAREVNITAVMNFSGTSSPAQQITIGDINALGNVNISLLVKSRGTMDVSQFIKIGDIKAGGSVTVSPKMNVVYDDRYGKERSEPSVFTKNRITKDYSAQILKRQRTQSQSMH
ncbi:MAG: hypothetical protein K2Q15_15340, partial [Burkholderiales bacterium]|nr:hypothetical protein [Burkholderiales bacterium]